MRLESLEDRRLMAVGPQLITVEPNDGGILRTGDTLSVEVVELTFRFNDGQVINPATLDGVRLIGSGFDGVFGDPIDGVGDDIVIQPGFIGIGDRPHEVVLRLEEPLPDDNYRIEVLGAGNSALENLQGEPFNGGNNLQIEFNLNLGPQVVAVVPQPIRRTPTGLSQARKQIEVYFNNDDLAAAAATNPAFYQLIFTNDTIENTDDATYNPTSVTYDPVANLAVLTFDKDLDQLINPRTGAPVGTATFRLRVGTNEGAPAPATTVTLTGDPGGSFSTAKNLGLLTHSLILGAAIDPQPNPLDFVGSEDEPGHRDVQIGIGNGTEQHVNPAFGPDRTLGVTTILYNFGREVGFTAAGEPILNFITEQQKQRVREAFEMWGAQLGVQFLETAQDGLQIATADPSAITPGTPDVVNYAVGKPNPDLDFIVRIDPTFANGKLILDGARQWRGTFGDDYYRTALTGIGFLLGLGHAGDLPAPTTMALGSRPVGLPPGPPAEQIMPGNADILHGQFIHRPDSNDIDLYKFRVDLGDAAATQKKTAVLAIETFAERRPNSSLLDTVVTLYREVEVRDGDGNVIGTRRELAARNDDYYSEDSYVELEVGTGTYFVQVTSAGNNAQKPEEEGTGSGGTTEGPYTLRMDLRPKLDGANVLRDLEGAALDGDGDGTPGGVYNFWFRAARPGDSIYVDKSHSITAGAVGTLANPFNSIDAAFAAARPGDVVRIVGNGGTDRNLATVDDNFPYEIGTSPLGVVLEDGTTMEVPRGVTTMIDSGAILKLLGARIGVGSSSLTIDRSGGALQVLGTPKQSVFFTSWLDEEIGLDPSVRTVPNPGDWGGIRFSADLDNAEGRFNIENEGIFLNYVNHSDMRFGGGRLSIGSVEQVVQPVQMIQSRPTITFNEITRSADAALSADPDSFRETNFHSPEFQLLTSFTSDYQRVGPEIHDNHLINNSTNGLFVSILTPVGDELQKLTVAARFDDTDVVHVLAENLEIQGTPGSAILDTSRPPVDLVALSARATGALAAGKYNYKVVFFDRNGFEGRPSDATSDVTLVSGQGSVRINNLPSVSGDYVGRRLYRSSVGGVGPYRLVAELNRTDTSFLDPGVPGTALLQRDVPDVGGVTLAARPGGTLAAGNYHYRVTFVATDGTESPASDTTASLALPGLPGDATIRLANLPVAGSGFIARRIYRSQPGGTGPHLLVAEINRTATTFDDTGASAGGELDPTLLGIVRARTDGRLRIDPGIVVKSFGARIEATFGSQLIAEGRPDRRVIFTSLLDDRYGAGGTFDTPSDGGTILPERADWGGIYLGQTAAASIDYALLTFGGGDTRIEGTFIHSNVLEVHQATLRLAHSIVENNDDGVEFLDSNLTDRIGRGTNEPATIFMRGSQPILLENIIRNNTAQALTLDVNSFTPQLLNDLGRETGKAGLVGDFSENYGPLIRRNILENNPNNGLNIRGGTLTTQSIWDDSDITHVLFEEILVPNFHSVGGLRLQSSPTSSLVVKFGGSGDPFEPHLSAESVTGGPVYNIDARSDYQRAFIATNGQSVRRVTQLDGSVIYSVTNTVRQGIDNFRPTSGITATGTQAAIEDRIGGIVQVVGQPDFPVILSSWHDDDLGAGFRLDGQIQRDTNNNGKSTVPQPGDWRSVRLEQFSHDRNVEIVIERESPGAEAPGPNSTPDSAQFLGNLASGEKTSDDKLRLGFEIQGLINAPRDVDVYSFTAAAGTEVWFDIDRTGLSLDSIVELISGSGQVIARSDNSMQETVDPNLLFHSSAIPASGIGPLQKAAAPYQPRHASGILKDFYSSNTLDAGMRVILPGAAGTRSNYHVRVRSSSFDLTNVLGGQTSGRYQLQLRLRETDELPGSTVRNSDIRFAMNGIEVIGLPGHSPLLGEAGENESVGGPEHNNQLLPDRSPAVNIPGIGPQDLGNLLYSDRGALSVAGNLSIPEDVDFFQFEVRHDNLASGNTSYGHTATIFDIDYADGLSRPNTNLSVFDRWGRLVLFAQDSNIADDQARGGDLSDLSTGSVGNLDPYIGSVMLPDGVYYAAVSSNAYVPRQLTTSPQLKREPVNSVQRIVEDHIDNSAGFATANPPDVSLFINDQSIRRIENVSAYILRDTEGSLDQSDITRVNIETGEVLFENLGFDGNAEDLTSRFNGSFFAFSTPDQLPAPNDFNTGLLRGVDTDFGQYVGAYDDGIETFRQHPTAVGVAVRADVGVRFNASAYGFIDGQEVLFAVGQRGDKDVVPRPVGPSAFNNLLYRFDVQTNRATSAPQADRVGNARMSGAGTQIVERGALNTNAGGGPGGTITGLEIINNQIYALSDTGGLFRVNNPFSSSASLTYIRDLTPSGFANPAALPTPVFGVINEVEENNSPATAQNLDKEIWTQRNDPNIADSTTSEHITIYGRGDGPFRQAFVANNIGTLDAPEGIALGPDGNFYVASRFTNEVLRFDGTTGDFIDVAVANGSGGLIEPTGIAFGPDGNLYVSSFGTGEILRFHRQSGLLIDSFADPAGSLANPMGLAFYDNGAGDEWLLVTDFFNSRVAAFDSSNGTYLFDIDAGNSAGLNGASGIVVDPANALLYVSSEFTNEVMQFDLATQAFVSVYVASGDGGLNTPHLGLALDGAGNLYVSSLATDEVLRYDTTGAFDTQFVRSDVGGLNGPAGLLFDAAGRLLVASSETDKVLRYATNGAFIDSLIPADAGGLDNPRDMTFDAAGNLYVTSADLSDSVLKFDPSGHFVRAIVRDSLGGLDDPWGIAISPHDGSLLVASQGTHQVLRYNATTGAFLGAFVTTRSGGLNLPTGITFGPDGDLYVSSFGNDAVLRYDGVTGAFDRLYVTPSTTLVGPLGLAFGPGNDLYVAGSASNNVVQFEGPSEATAGRFVTEFIAPGVNISEPQDIEFTATELYVSNAGDSSVVRFNLSDGSLKDVFVPSGNEGLDRPVGIAFRPNTRLFYVSSSNTDEVLEFDADSAPTFDYFQFSVDEDQTRVVIDVDFADRGGPRDPNTQLFLLDAGGAQLDSNDDFSPLAGGTGSTRRTDAILGGDRNNPLILDRGTYIVAIDEFDPNQAVETLDNPLDLADTYVLHISMDKRRDTAEGPVVVREFEGLARRPQQVAGDRFQNVLFAVDSQGDVYSYNLAGQPVPFFPGSSDKIETGAAHARGIALSASLWQQTTSRSGDVGHGLSEVFDDSRGGSLSIPENEPNNTLGSAHDLELERWSVGYDSNIGDDFDDVPLSINTSTFIPHITVEGRGQGSVLTGTATRDFYSFVVTKPDSYVQIETDFDLAYQHRANGAQPGNDPAGPALPYGEGVMDSAIFLFNAAGGIVAASDNIAKNYFGDGGTSWGTPDSPNTIDNDVPIASHESYFDVVLQPGVYIVEVRKNDPETLRLTEPEEGDRYTLQISVEGHAVTRDDRLDGGASYVFGTTYTGPVLNATASDPVQITSPQHGLQGGETVYVEGVRGIRQANGTYVVSKVSDDVFELVNADGTDDPFSPDGPYAGGGTWRLATLQRDMQASLVSNPFSLKGYAAADRPVLYFNYALNLDPAAGDFRVSVVRGGSVLGQVLSKADLVNLQGSCGDTNPFSPCPRDIWRQAHVGLQAFAGQDNLQLLFEFDTRGMDGVAFEGAFIDDIVIGAAERGEMVSGAYNNATFVPANNGTPNEILTGAYQLEIRRATPFGVSQPVGQGAPNDNTLRLTQTIGTNDRLANQSTLLAPAGSAITDGQTFTIGDGNRMITFEYDSNNSLTTPGNSRVRFAPGDSVATVAANIQAAINSTSVQRVLKIQAGPGGHGEVHLFGNAAVDASQIDVRIHEAFGDSNLFRDQGQVLITSNFINDSRDFGIVAVAGDRNHGEMNPAGLQNSHYGAPRNLQALNPERLAPGVTIENNVIASDGLGGIHLGGDPGVWELVPRRPTTWPLQESAAASGNNIFDGDAFIVTALGQKVRFEFEDISGSGPPAGSGSQGGNGWTPGSVPIFYRRSSGYLVLRGLGFTQTEMVYAIREAIHTSILASSSMQVDAIPGSSRRIGGALLGADPALYLSNVSSVEVVRGAPFLVNRRTPLHQAAQPLAKIVNNTVYGSDGLASQFVGDPRNEPNDIVSQAVTTHQGRSNLPAKYIAQGNIGDGVTTPADPSLDVDLYRIYLGIGDRVVVDIDASERGTGLDSVLRLFNSVGQEVASNDDQAAPGESFSFDSYLDFTTQEAGTYYVGVSGAHNDRYSALGLGGLVGPASRGDYTIDIDVQSAESWVIRAVDGTLVPDGTTITVSDRVRTVVFELDSVAAPGVAAGNVPIVFDPTPIGNPRGPGYRPPEMAAVIAETIQAQFPNTIVSKALPGFRGATAGVKNLPTPLDYNGQNFGHDYDPSRVFYGAPATLGPFATGELFAVVRGAANVTLPANSPFTLGPDPADPTIVDQLIAETGILITGNASPTLLNNLVANVHTGIFQEDSASTIMGASLFQHNVRDHNINPLNESFSITLNPREPLFESADDRNFYPASFARAIDSSIDSLEDRDAFVTLKSILGIAPSPVLAPDRDAAGQLRVDDSTVDPPDGFGANVFKDRGGVDRADFEGPNAVLVNPRDNDAERIDLDPTETVVQLANANLTHISIQLVDRATGSDAGIGVDDSTVTAQKFTVIQNGLLLTEGVDYEFDYDARTNTIRLTHISGLWPNNSVYVVRLSNRDRYVINVPDGSQFQDGQSFFIQDQAGNTVTFEYESGYSIFIPETLTLRVPAQGIGPGGIADGHRFVVFRPGGLPVTFEYDSNVPPNFVAGNRPIDISGAVTAEDVAVATISALNAASLGLSPVHLGGGAVHVGARAGYRIDASLSNLTVTGQASVIADGNTVRVGSVVFEFENTNIGDGVAAGNTAIPFSDASTQNDLANALVAAITNAGLGLSPRNLGAGRVLVGGQATQPLDASGAPELRVVGAPGVQGTTQLALPGPLSLQVPSQGAGPGGITDRQFVTIDDGARNAELALGFPAPNDLNTAIRVVGNRQLAGVAVEFRNTRTGNVAVAQLDNVTRRLIVDLSVTATTSATIVNAINTLGVPSLSASLDTRVDTTNNGTGIPGAVGRLGVLDPAVKFEFELLPNPNGVSPGAVPIPFSVGDTISQIADSIVAAIASGGVGLSPTHVGGGLIELGVAVGHVVDASRSALIRRGKFGGVADGETFVIDNRFDSKGPVTFEFDKNNRVGSGNRAIRFTSSSTPDEIVDAMIAAISLAQLGLQPVNIGGGRLDLRDTYHHATDTVASSLERSGVPGGAVPINFVPDATFTPIQLADTIIAAIAGSVLTGVSVSNRGADTYFLDGATSVGGDLPITFVGAIQDLANNNLLANQASNETKFTILMPGVQVDYGDAPAPRYPTLFANGAARHAIAGNLFLGASVDAELDGLASALANGDDRTGADDEDGVRFGSIFNSFLVTPTTVTASGQGFLDGWIDFNRDGDWTDPGEQVFNSRRLEAGANELGISTPANALIGKTFARFRFSSAGNLLPSGLAADGEVEDYQVEIVGGTPPVANNDSYTTHEDAVFSVPAAGVLANDTDVDGDALSVISADSSTAMGVNITVNTNGSFVYDPSTSTAIQSLAAGAFVDDTFTYQAGDGILPSLSATVTIRVNGRNDNPTAAAANVAATEDGSPVTAPFAGDDIDSDDDQTTLTYSIVAVPAEGSVANNGDGTFTFSPGSDFQNLAVGETRQVTFTYRATDRHSATSKLGTVTVTVTGTNDAPVASNQSINAVEDGGPVGPTRFAGDDVDSDDRQATLTYAIVTGLAAGQGTVTNNDNGTFTYNPGNAFQDLGVGETAEVSFTYRATDSHGVASGVGRVTITITGVNDAPLAIRNDYQTDEETVLQGNVVTDDTDRGVDSDPDGDPLQVSRVNGSVGNVGRAITLTSGAVLTVQSSGVFSYDPTNAPTLRALKIGERFDDSFTYTISDGRGGVSTATVNVAVFGANEKPVAVNDTYTVAEGGTLNTTDATGGTTTGKNDNGVLANDSDPEDDPLTITIVTQPQFGILTMRANGTFTYVHDGSETSRDSFVYRITDPTGGVSDATATINVTPVNDRPVATADAYAVDRSRTLRVTDPDGKLTPNISTDNGVLLNDTDAEGSALTARLISGPTHASAFTLNSNGTFTYTNNGNTATTDSFTYVARDGSLDSAVTTVTITVNAPPPPPWQNPRDPRDVNNDGAVSPIDALLIVNYLNFHAQNNEPLPLPSETFSPPPFYDVNGDGFASPVDVALVINFLNSRPSRLAEGESAARRSRTVRIVEEGTTQSTAGATVIDQRSSGSAVATKPDEVALPQAGPVRPADERLPRRAAASPLEQTLVAIVADVHEAAGNRTAQDLAWEQLASDDWLDDESL